MQINKVLYTKKTPTEHRGVERVTTWSIGRFWRWDKKEFGTNKLQYYGCCLKYTGYTGVWGF